MKPIIAYKAHYSAPPQAKLFLDFLLTNHQTANTGRIQVELKATTWKKKNGCCVAQEFRGSIHDTIRVSVGTKEKPRSTPHILRTLAHEYCHVMQFDTLEGLKYDPSMCVEANAFASRVVPEFLTNRGIILVA